MSDRTYTDAKGQAMAHTVLSKTLGVRAGEAVTIETWSETLPWATAFVLEARRMGARPILLLEDESTYWKSLEESAPKTLGTPGKHEWALLEKTDAYVFFWGPSDLPRAARVPEKTQELLTAYDDRWFETANRAGLRLARMFLGRISEASANSYGVDADEWRRELVEATLVDPEILRRSASKIARRLKEGTSLTVTHSNGTELELRLKHRDPRVYDGYVHAIHGGIGPSRGPHGIGTEMGALDTPMPAGYVVTALDEDFAEGRFRANHSDPVPMQHGTGGTWEFRGGRLVSHSYESGAREFDRAFGLGGRGRDSPGSISIGLNPKLDLSPWMGDQALGTVTLTLGNNRMSGGSTDAHFFAFLILRGGTVRVDGKYLVRNGKLS